MRRAGEQGFALVAVLAVMVVGAMLAAAALSLARAGTRTAADYSDVIEGGAAAQAAIDLAAIRLVDAEGSDMATAAASMEWGGWTVAVRIEDEAGKLDINRTDAPRISSALLAAGIRAGAIPPRRRFVAVDDLADALGLQASALERMRGILTVYGAQSPAPPGPRSALETYRILAVARRGDRVAGRWAIVRVSPGFGEPFEWLERGVM